MAWMIESTLQKGNMPLINVGKQVRVRQEMSWNEELRSWYIPHKNYYQIILANI